MIIWLASYPCSGNTFLRISLHAIYGITSYVVYDHDGVLRWTGPELVGARARTLSLPEMDESDKMYLVKTHRHRTDERRAICLVRDGRDAIVSWAHLRAVERNSTFDAQLREIVGETGRVDTGGWGSNVLSWLSLPQTDRALLRYEDLVRDPVQTVRRAVARVAPDLAPVETARVPTFDELRQVSGTFFRRGEVGSHRDELPDGLHDLFWAQPDNVAAMEAIGYRR